MKERGIALLAGLVLMASIGLLALSAASGMILQRNMAFNYQEDALALENASIAGAWAMAWLYSRSVIERESGCADSCLQPIGIRSPGELPARPEFESAEWWRSNAIASGYNPETTQAVGLSGSGAEPSRWIIEEIHYAPTGDPRDENLAESVAYYRILSRGTGLNARSVAVTETIAARPWEGNFQPGTYPPDGPSGTFCRQFEDRYDCGRLSWRQRR